MYKVTVTHSNGMVCTYKSPFRCDDVKVKDLPYMLRLERDYMYAPDEALVHWLVGATIEHERLDGRTKEAKKLRYYTVRYIL